MNFFCLNTALEGLRKRKGNLTISNDHRNASKMIGFEIEPGEEVKTDKAKDGGFQKVVRFTHDASKVVTGGADGHFRVWKVLLSFYGIMYLIAACPCFTHSFFTVSYYNRQ